MYRWYRGHAFMSTLLLYRVIKPDSPRNETSSLRLPYALFGRPWRPIAGRWRQCPRCWSGRLLGPTFLPPFWPARSPDSVQPRWSYNIPPQRPRPYGRRWWCPRFPSRPPRLCPRTPVSHLLWPIEAPFLCPDLGRSPSPVHENMDDDDNKNYYYYTGLTFNFKSITWYT